MEMEHLKQKVFEGFRRRLNALQEKQRAYQAELDQEVQLLEGMIGEKLPQSFSLHVGEAVPSSNAAAPPAEKPAKRRKRKKRTGEYSNVLAKMPEVIKKIGAHGKRFTKSEVIAVLNQHDITSKPEWVSNILRTRITGIEVVGHRKGGGPQPLNVYKVTGEVATK